MNGVNCRTCHHDVGHALADPCTGCIGTAWGTENHWTPIDHMDKALKHHELACRHYAKHLSSEQTITEEEK